ncbi:Sulfide dehydrogenase subunit alpha [uncultured Desulfobacterium sp.]|uniref:Sulfide dehydrogenase subunit alpha n=1 Tax=uncultured Desulfobacterium sp. TaxID=201089 RepID=A0A445N3Q9_9BACT|nr:Sulfide dehydrogenase subunit alpha [uncultured Desulfobacterium sp.]
MPKKIIIPKKTQMLGQAPADRINNFNEVTWGYTEEQAMAEAGRCMECARPGCIEGCPVNINIPGFIKLVAEGDFRAAVNLVKETNALPAITGRVCPQEGQCEGLCALGKKHEPVGIGNLERFVADWEALQGNLHVPIIAPATGKKVAVAGSGPAGLTVAAELARSGHSVTVFEALHEAGGVLAYGIPEFRLPKAIVRREVEFVCSLGVRLVRDFIVGNTATVDELLEEFDAVFLGTGAGLPWFLGIAGENLAGVYSANEYLTRSNLMKAYRFPEYDTPIAHGRRVITIGGGNVAMDAARTALRLGAQESIIVYRRTRNEMPARLEEIRHAEEEGIVFELLTTPVAFHGADGRVTEAECIRNKLGKPDASGRSRPVPVSNSNFCIAADIVVIAVGQSPSPLIHRTTPDIDIGRAGAVAVDEKTMKTSKKGVFAGGDVATGGATVILAMGQAKIASRAIAEYLRTGEW